MGHKYKCTYKRAITIQEKTEVINELLKLWIQAPMIRLGQLIWNSFEGHLFFIEDYDLIEILKSEIKIYIPKQLKNVKKKQ